MRPKTTTIISSDSKDPAVDSKAALEPVHSPSAERATQPSERYSLLKIEAKLTDEHKKNIAESFRNMGKMEIPFQYLRKNSPDRQFQHGEFNKAALTFIALVNAFGESNKKSPYSLADLVDIIKYCWENCKESRPQIIACLAYTLPIHQYTAVFLELLPAKDKFEPKDGFSRESTSVYDAFFPQLAEAVSENYLAVFSKFASDLTLEYVQFKNLNDIQIKAIEEELKPILVEEKLESKILGDSDELSQKSKSAQKLRQLDELTPNSLSFVTEVIHPIINFLRDTQKAIPPELKYFLYESGRYLLSFGRKDVDPLTQLCGLFFTKLTHPAIVLQAKTLDLIPKKALFIASSYIQRLTTLTRDDRLYNVMEAISQETVPSKPYLPFAKSSDGTFPAMGRSPEIFTHAEILEETKKLLTDPAHAKVQAEAKPLSSALQSTKDFSQSSSSDEESSARGIRLQKRATEKTPLRPKAAFNSKIKECDRWVTAKLLASSLPAVGGGLSGNSTILQDVHLLSSDSFWVTKVGPYWSTLIGATPGLIFLLVIILYHCCRNSAGNSNTAHKDLTPSGAGVFADERKIGREDTATDEDHHEDSFASAEEGDTPRPPTH